MVVANNASTLSAIMSATQTSVQRSEHSTLRPHGIEADQFDRGIYVWAGSYGETSTTTIRATILLRILVRSNLPETIAQDRSLTNAGVRSDISYVKGIHNVKAGVVYEQTLLTENDHLGIIDPNSECSLLGWSPTGHRYLSAILDSTIRLNAYGNSTNPALYPTPFVANPTFVPLLGCIDLPGRRRRADGCGTTSSVRICFTVTRT